MVIFPSRGDLYNISLQPSLRDIRCTIWSLRSEYHNLENDSVHEFWCTCCCKMSLIYKFGLTLSDASKNQYRVFHASIHLYTLWALKSRFCIGGCCPYRTLCSSNWWTVMWLYSTQVGYICLIFVLTKNLWIGAIYQNIQFKVVWYIGANNHD